MQTPTIVFDYISRVATQVGRDRKADRKAAKTLTTPSTGVAKATGGRPATKP